MQVSEQSHDLTYAMEIPRAASAEIGKPVAKVRNDSGSD